MLTLARGDIRRTHGGGWELSRPWENREQTDIAWLETEADWEVVDRDKEDANRMHVRGRALVDRDAVVVQREGEAVGLREEELVCTVCLVRRRGQRTEDAAIRNVAEDVIARLRIERYRPEMTRDLGTEVQRANEFVH